MRKILITAAVVVSSFGFSEVQAQNNNEGPNFAKVDVSPMDVALFRDEAKEPVARVLYSRPQMRGREIFGKLVPYGQVWRTGANEATELKLYKDMKVGNEIIEEGTYTLFTIPEEDYWTFILNKSTNIWGAYDYQVENDEVRIKVPVRKAPTSIEALSMAFEPTEEGAELQIGWEDQYVEVPFEDPEE